MYLTTNTLSREESVMPERTLNEKHFDFQFLRESIHLAVCYFGTLRGSVNPKRKTSAVLLYKSLEGTFHDHIVGIGEIEYEKCLETAKRKITALEENPAHLTSFPSRDGILNWGGAYNLARLGLGKVALSGLTEKGDDACVLNGLEHQGLVQNSFIADALTESNNRDLFLRIWVKTR